ncbi:dynamin family protein [Spirillospora sp. NBC_00431]
MSGEPGAVTAGRLHAETAALLDGFIRLLPDDDPARTSLERSLASLTAHSGDGPVATLHATRTALDRVTGGTVRSAASTGRALKDQETSLGKRLTGLRDERARLTAARERLPAADAVRDDLTRRAVHAVAAAERAGLSDIERLAREPLPGAGRSRGRRREHARMFASAYQARRYLTPHCAAVAADLEGHAHTALSALTADVRERFHRLLADEDALPRAGGLPPTRAEVASSIAFRWDVTAAVTKTLADAVSATIRPAEPTTALRDRIVLADRPIADLSLRGRRTYLVSRDALGTALGTSWRQAVQDLERAVTSQVGDLHKNVFADVLAKRDSAFNAHSRALAEETRSAETALREAAVRRHALDELVLRLGRLRANAATLTGARANGAGFPPVLRWALAPVPHDALKRQARSLRVAVVAPMSAGKSTLINALLGIDLLPTRHTAMSCVPTRVLLEAPGTPPALAVDGTTRDEFYALADRIRTSAEPDGRALRHIERHGHLSDLLRKVRGGERPDLTGTGGPGAVRAALTTMNDLVRLGLLLEPERPLPRALRDGVDVHVAGPDGATFPIEVIDTPGLDEAGMTGRFTAVVEDEVNRAHAVLAVLDFTRLGGVPDTEIAGLLERFVSEAGPEGLWVAVNRVDQRRRGDRDRAGVRGYVRRRFGLGAPWAADRVVETAAYKAEAALAHLRGTGRPEELLAIRYPGDWQERLPGAGPGDLDAIARRLVAGSGLPALRRTLLTPLLRDGGTLAGRVTVRRALRDTGTALRAPVRADLALGLALTEGLTG